MAKRVCSTVTRPGWASCLSVVRTDVAGHKGLYAADATPGGYGPNDLQDAYDLPSATGGAGQTVAIVDAFDDPNVEADLQVYRAQYGLPECSTANGCFSKVNQQGQAGSYPAPNSGWAEEISLDVDMVSAICPSCHITLVEANDNQLDSLGTSVNTAVALGAKYVSNSYGGAEDPSETTLDAAYFDHPGVAVTASSGDSGYGVSYPAASPDVTSVGGTSLSRTASGRGWTESAWAGAGSGCSQFEAKPSWQLDSGCSMRTVADVSAVANPNTGVAVYDSYQDSGWAVFGGTSVAAPIIASTYALAGAPAAGSNPAQYPYDTASALNDVTSGSNGSCSPAYLCTSGPDYDGPTGLGTPSGIDAFRTGPHGVVTGTVSDAATGAPLAGAGIDVGALHATTAADGSYHVRAPVGDYPVTASHFGYESKSVPDVAVLDGVTTTQDFALTAVPNVTVHGTVRDGSGHGWPLYAKVQVPGTPAATYTDPKTGAYSLTVPQAPSYDIEVDSAYAGYQQATRQIDASSGDVSLDFDVPVDATTCAAPGYRFTYTGATQPFDSTSAPAGWSVRNAAGTAHGFEFDNPGGLPNNTGGSGNFAVADGYHYGSYLDTSLVSPVMDLSADTTPVVQWNQDLEDFDGTTATVDLSIDGGATWANVFSSSGFPGAPGPSLAAIPLPSAAGKSQVQVRFHYANDYGQWWWAIDNAFVGNRVCQPVAGGLVVGTVTDSASGAGINGASVASSAHPADAATTMRTPDDPHLGDGFYHVFSSGIGSQRFTASKTGYASANAQVNVVANSVTALGFALHAR